jgi:hypothetical protein
VHKPPHDRYSAKGRKNGAPAPRPHYLGENVPSIEALRRSSPTRPGGGTWSRRRVRRRIT